MSSKILQIYPLTVYPTGNIMGAWRESRCKVFSANDADTLGFPVRIVTKSRECVQSVSRLIGINPVSQTAKRKNGANEVVPLPCDSGTKSQRPRYEWSRCFVDEASRGFYGTTMTTVRSSVQITM